MNTIISWIRELVWETSPLSIKASTQCLTAQVLIGPDPELPSDETADVLLAAADAQQAAAMLTHLAKLGTVERVIVSGTSQLTLAERRHLSKVARRQRRHGLLVQIVECEIPG